MEILHLFWIVVQCIIGYNLVLPVVLFLCSKISRRKTIDHADSETSDYAVIVTAYAFTESLPSCVASILSLNYERFTVYVVADNCDTSNLRFNDSRVILLQPEEVLSSNTRSHFYAIDRFVRAHNRLIIIDSDNLVHLELLNEVDFYFNQGYEAIQGLRAAKNLDTTYACLDAARDIYYHYYDGKLLFELGSSATLSGSGMAFSTALYKKCLEFKPISGAGFDKVLQYEIVKQDKRIAFAPKAIVFDEKTSIPEQLVNQRSRWINTWFKYFKFGFGLLTAGIKKGSINQILFGIILLRPPLFMFLILSAICFLINIFVAPITALIWLAALSLFIFSFGIALYNSETDSRIYKSLSGIPSFIFYQIISLTNVKRANKRSVSTQHFHSDMKVEETKPTL